MNNKELFSHLVALQKTMFKHQYNLITTWQNQGEQLAKSSMQYNPWCAGNGKTVCTFWAEALRQNNKYAKEFMDSNFSVLEQYMDAPESSVKTADTKSSETAAKQVQPVNRPSMQQKDNMQDTTLQKPAAAKTTVTAKKTAAKKAAPAKQTSTKKEPTTQTGAAKKRAKASPTTTKASKTATKASPTANKATSTVEKAAPRAKKSAPVQQELSIKRVTSSQPTPAPQPTTGPGTKSSGPVKA